MRDPHFPVPFVFDELPTELQPLVAAAGESGLEASGARRAIAEHWEDGGDRTPALLLAFAYLGVKDACEIMVDEQLDQAREALQLVAEARALGAPDTPGLAAFESLAQEIAGEEAARKEHLERFFGVDPSTLDEELAASVAYELCERGRQAEAIPYFTRVIELVPPARRLHYAWNRAGCQAKVGRLDEARAFYEYVLRDRSDADPFIVAAAYEGLLAQEDDDAAFRQLFAKALAWAEERGHRFPVVHQNQERFLDRAVAADWPDLVQHLCDVIEARDGRLPAALAKKLTRARRAIA